MTNITLTIDDEILEKAQIVAAEKHTTVTAMVREFLSDLASREVKFEQGRRRIVELIDRSAGDMGPDWKWNREDAYER